MEHNNFIFRLGSFWNYQLPPLAQAGIIRFQFTLVDIPTNYNQWVSSDRLLPENRKKLLFVIKCQDFLVNHREHKTKHPKNSTTQTCQNIYNANKIWKGYEILILLMPSLWVSHSKYNVVCFLWENDFWKKIKDICWCHTYVGDQHCYCIVYS